MQDTLVISYEALHSCVTNIAVTNCFKLATVQSRPETAVRPNHTKFVYEFLDIPKAMCAHIVPNQSLLNRIMFMKMLNNMFVMTRAVLLLLRTLTLSSCGPSFVMLASVPRPLIIKAYVRNGRITNSADITTTRLYQHHHSRVFSQDFKVISINFRERHSY